MLFLCVARLHSGLPLAGASAIVRQPPPRLRKRVTFHDFLLSAVAFLAAAVVAVPLFRRLGLSAVLGYLVAGVALGPFGVAVVADPQVILTYSQIGVVMLLFLVGLELTPRRLWLMRHAVFGYGSAQVWITTLALAVPLGLWGLDWTAALIAGFALALSATAVSLQVLAERRELGSAHGRLGFAILLAQDIWTVPALALLPVLGAATQPDAVQHPVTGFLTALAVIATVVVGGHFLLRPLFRIASAPGQTEVFTALALLVVLGTASLMETAGLSMALGAFLAGVLLADSEYRHAIEAAIEPFKGLLLGLFFLAVGMSMDVGQVLAQPLTVALLILGLIALKGGVLAALARVHGLDGRQSLRLALLLPQGGEFTFVLLAMAAAQALMPADAAALLIAASILSLAISPLLVRLGDLLPPEKREAPKYDVVQDDAPRVIIAGFGRMGQIVARILRAQGIPFTALESSPEQVEVSRRFGNKIYFGDPSRAELLRAAGAEQAELFVLTTDDPEANIRTARLVKRLFPQLRIIARARNRQHAFRLMDLGIEAIIRETLHSSLEMSRIALTWLGEDPDTAWRRVEQFRDHDEQVLRTQHLAYDDEAKLVQTTKEAFEDLQALFEADRGK
jgi:glutathione-regulated potassium-efflux system protein KefB